MATIINHQSPITNRDLWSRVLSMGAIGSATMTAVIIIAGIAAMMIGDLKFVIGDLWFSYFLTIAIVLLLLGLALYFAPRLLKRWAVVTHKLVAISLGQSFLRLLCWCVQLFLALFALGAITPSLPHSFIPSSFHSLSSPLRTCEEGMATKKIHLFGACLSYGIMSLSFARDYCVFRDYGVRLRD